MKLYSFYLPQFHPIPENDSWWGKCFTEWRNVALSKPLFKGHRQPQIPADLPLNDVVADKNYNFPYAVCWANETWSRAWDGLDHEILINQTYSLEDHERHAEYLIGLFKDERYIKVNNRPLFLIFSLIPKISPNLRESRIKLLIL